MKRINWALIIIASIGGIYYSINSIVSGGIYKTLICLSIIPVMLVPTIIKKIFKIKLTATTEFVYLIFVFVAHFLGSIVNLYHTVNNYDKLMHLVSGIVSAFFAIVSLVYMKKYDHKNTFFNVLFIIAFVLMIASIWEFFEYFSDKIFSKDAQNVFTTGVNDTMDDMVAAFIGAILFSIIYIYEQKTKNNGLINKYVKEMKNIG